MKRKRGKNIEDLTNNIIQSFHGQVSITFQYVGYRKKRPS